MRTLCQENSERIQNWVQQHREDTLAVLKEIVSVPSVKGPAREGMPYGAA